MLALVQLVLFGFASLYNLDLTLKPLDLKIAINFDVELKKQKQEKRRKDQERKTNSIQFDNSKALN